MKLTVYAWITLALVIISAGISVAFYPSLPDRVPTHFNLRGDADGYSSRTFGAFFPPVMLAAVWLLFLAAPAISPRGFLMDSFPRAWGATQVAVMLMLFAVTVIIPLKALGYQIPVERVMPAMLGVLFIVIGNYLGKVTRNFFFGIRTPWTLASEEVWFRTHRLGAKVFVITGIATAIIGIAGAGLIAVVPLLLVAGFVPVVYSYVIYRRIG